MCPDKYPCIVCLDGSAPAKNTGYTLEWLQLPSCDATWNKTRANEQTMQFIAIFIYMSFTKSPTCTRCGYEMLTCSVEWNTRILAVIVYVTHTAVCREWVQWHESTVGVGWIMGGCWVLPFFCSAPTHAVGGCWVSDGREWVKEVKYNKGEIRAIGMSGWRNWIA